MLGSGTTLDPYQVATASDLNDVRNDLHAYYIQTADIDLSGYANWVPIGAVFEDADCYQFDGFYDGQNFSISNLTMSYPEDGDYSYYFGLFGIIGDYMGEVALSEVKNINLVNVNIDAAYYTGALAGMSFAKVTNCKSSGIISGRGQVGGLIGSTYDVGVNTEYHMSDVVGCSSSCDIYTASYDQFSWAIGGLIGYVGNYYTSKCYATGTIRSIYEPAEDDWSAGLGGFAGDALGDRIRVGGVFVADHDRYVIIENCYAMGDVLGGDIQIGGFLGYTSYIVKTINCYSKGLITATYDQGGFLGDQNDDFSATSCYYDTETSGQSDNDGRGVPKTTAEMKTQGTFVDWDFSTIWVLDSGNDGYPHFITGVITSVQCSALNKTRSAKTNQLISFIRK